jgi:hypothetical protein
MCVIDQSPSSNFKVIYFDNKNNEVEEYRALRKMTNYYDNSGNLFKYVIKIRFSLNQTW